VVLEAGRPAHRASGRNAGFLLTGSAQPFLAFAEQVGEARALAFWRRSLENRRLLRRELLDSGRVQCEFLPEGSWIAAVDEAEKVAELRACGERLVAAGFDIEWREKAEVQRASGSPLLGGALFQPQDGGLDPVRLARGLVRDGGFELRRSWPVGSLEPAGERVRLASERGELTATAAVVAVNAYAPALLPFLDGQVHPVRGQVLATAPGPRPLQGVWYVDGGFEYARQLGDGTLILGGGRRSALEDEVGFEEEPTPPVQQAIDAFRRSALPALAERQVVRRWAGVMAFTDDGLPRLGEHPGIANAFYAAGFNGHGLSLAFATGRHLARRVCGEAVAPLFAAASAPA
jgi:glycine/D-amino acid oxidase-like deaminating enzyme